VKRLDSLVIYGLTWEAREACDGGFLSDANLVSETGLQLTIRRQRNQVGLVFELNPVFPRFYVSPRPLPRSGGLPPGLKDHLKRLHGAVVRVPRPGNLEGRFTMELTVTPSIGVPVRHSLVAEFAGSGTTLFLVNAAGRILAAWPSRGKSAPGGHSGKRREAADGGIPGFPRDMVAGILQAGLASGKPPEEALREALPVLPPYLLAEIIARTGRNFTPDTVIDLLDGWLEEVRAEGRKGYLYWTDSGDPLFTAVPLTSSRYGGPVVYPGLSAALSEGLKEAVARQELELKRNKALAGIRRLRKRFTRLAGKQEADLERAERYAGYERLAQLLAAQIHLARKGEERVVLPDILSGSGEPVEIPLDRRLTPGENVKRLFELARKGRRGMELARERLEGTKRMIGKIEQAAREVETAASAEAIDRVMDSLPAGKAAAGEPGTGGKEKGLFARLGIRPRRFVTSGGYTVLVGRSARENDILVTRVAAPGDIWFHVRGAGGSHAVLLRPERKSWPSPADIREASMLAAYFSKQRGAGQVPVDYAERRYVRKRKGSPPGEVMVTRSKTIMVKPSLIPGKSGS